MQHTDFTITKASGQPRKPRNQAEFRSVYIADLTRAAEANGTLSNLTNIPTLPIPSPTSRTGRKSLRKPFDADCRRLRREAGVPAVSGPPIPGSEHNGHRRFYTLEQCRQGQRLSAIARRDQALPRWLQIQTLHYRRHSLRDIARTDWNVQSVPGSPCGNSRVGFGGKPDGRRRSTRAVTLWDGGQ